MRKFAFVATILIAGALSGCLANQRRQQYAQASLPKERPSRESICEDVYSVTLLAPTRTGESAEGISNATLARA